MLADRLGWPMEFIVRTKMPRGSGYPPHYKIDIAEPALQVAAEVDGQSHLAKERIAQDVKKDEFLEYEGWIVVRVRNEEVLDDCESVAQRILSSTSKHPLATTSRTAFWSTIAIA
jgi:very-short-patch-repair endonuclease